MSAPVGNASSVDLYWLPLGAGGPRIVRRSGHLYEAVAAWHGRRAVVDLYHSALLVRLRGESYAIEMARSGVPRSAIAVRSPGGRWVHACSATRDCSAMRSGGGAAAGSRTSPRLSVVRSA